jgi:hypothetical protein
MKVEKVLENMKRVNDALYQAVELMPEHYGELSFTMLHGFDTDTEKAHLAESFEIYDMETDHSTRVSAALFWKRIAHYTVDELEEMDAIEITDVAQKGVFGEVVYG